MKPIRVGVIDSGYDINCQNIQRYIRKNVRIEDNNTLKQKEYDNGHCTAIIEMITRNIEPDSIEVYVYSIFSNNQPVLVESLKRALQLACVDNINILNCSLGTIDPSAYCYLLESITCLQNNGCIIVSASNDQGFTTWPSNFEKTISVKSGDQKSQLDWKFEEGKKEQLVFRGTKQKVTWGQNKYAILSGSSFATALCTNSLIRNYLNGYIQLDYESISKFYKDNATKVIKYDKESSSIIPWNYCFDQIKKAGIYPFNKEMHNLIHFEKNLKFDIRWVSDFRLSKNTGKYANQILLNCQSQLFINRGLPEDAQNIDSLVIGYLDKVSGAEKTDLLSQALNYALARKLNVFSLTPPADLNYWEGKFNQNNCWIKTPLISEDTIKEILIRIPEKKNFDTPIVAVIGTSRSQGKFYMQLKLRFLLEERGFKVGQLGSEHQSELFGIEFTFPNGYDYRNCLNLPLEFHIPFIRRIIAEMDKGQYDIIISGMQSGLINANPYDYNNILSELVFAAIIPDRVILIMNKKDDSKFIQRIENYVFAKTGEKIFKKVIYEEMLNGNYDFESLVSNLINC